MDIDCSGFKPSTDTSSNLKGELEMGYNLIPTYARSCRDPYKPIMWAA